MTPNEILYEWMSRVETLEAELRSVYRERAHLVAHLASHVHLVGRLGEHAYAASYAPTDPATPGYGVATVQTPTGQMAWHIANADADLIHPAVKAADPIPWDGHSTEEKYQRLDALTAAYHDGTGEAVPAAAPVPEQPAPGTDGTPEPTPEPLPATPLPATDATAELPDEPDEPADTDDAGKEAA